MHEHKHFAPWETHEKTTVFTEFSKETEPEDTPYYPKRLTTDMSILEQYQELASEEQNVSFIGRLATYRYLDMHVVMAEALQTAREFIRAPNEEESPPVFVGETA